MPNEKLSVKTLQAYCSVLSVLYVEDEPDIRATTEKVLAKLFKVCDVAENGETGLALYREKKPDLVVTDIRMPTMNGLEMIAGIQQIRSDQPFMITSAHGEAGYFSKAIELGVDSFVLKPLQQEQFFRALLKSVKQILLAQEEAAYKKTLEELIAGEIERNLEQEQERLRAMASVVEAYPNPTCIADKKMRIHYANSAFKTLFEVPEEALATFPLESRFLEREGFISRAGDLNPDNPTRNTVAIAVSGGRKIFRVVLRPVELEPGQMETLFAFNDITVEEYNKLKIQHYSERLEDLIVRRYKRREHQELPAAPASAPEKLSAVAETEPETAAKNTRIMERTESEVLRRSHTHKTDAVTYAAEVDEYVLEELQELEEIEKEVKEDFAQIEFEGEKGHLKQIAQGFLKYASTISLLFEFEDLSFAIRGIGELLDKTEYNTLDEKQVKKLLLLGGTILEDLMTWRQTIFIEQTTQDIHYLDSSLFSSCLQLEMGIFGQEAEESDEDDLVLF